MWSTIEEYSIAIKIVNKKIKNKKTAIKILTTHAWLEYIPWPSGHDNELYIWRERKLEVTDPLRMDLTAQTKVVKYEQILCEQTQGGWIKRPRGTQLIIMWSPRNPKWK